MCRSWNNCSTNIQRQGCTFYDLLVQVLQYPEWSWLTTGDDIQPYKEAIDALHHSCNNIEPGTNTRRVARILHWRGGGHGSCDGTLCLQKSRRPQNMSSVEPIEHFWYSVERTVLLYWIKQIRPNKGSFFRKVNSIEDSGLCPLATPLTNTRHLFSTG